MTISNSNGLPDIVSVQKKVYPLIYTDIVSEQPTTQPVATAYGFKAVDSSDDGSGWTEWAFNLNRWSAQVQSHRMKTTISRETVEDLQAMGVSDDLITLSLADQIANEINSDIINALNIVSPDGDSIDVSTMAGNFDKGRELYASIHIELAKLEKKTGFVGNYVVASDDAFGLLLGSGMVTAEDESNVYIMDSGVKLIHDKTSTDTYVTIGVKKDLDDFELSSIVFSPYKFDGDTNDTGIAYQYKTQDPQSFHPVYGLISRYALTSAPLSDDKRNHIEIDWTNPGEVENSSVLSTTHVVTI